MTAPAGRAAAERVLAAAQDTDWSVWDVRPDGRLWDYRPEAVPRAFEALTRTEAPEGACLTPTTA